MILYLDTSALVKLYVEERGSDLVRQALGNCTVAATSQVAYAEARAAFARACREAAIAPEDYYRVIASFRTDWDNYLAVAVTDRIVYLAGDLAESQALRGFDAIHLASLLTLRQKVRDAVVAACWDGRLWQAIKANNFPVIPGDGPRAAPAGENGGPPASLA